MELILEYDNWPDEKRKRFQKAWFKLYYDPEKVKRIWDGMMIAFAEEWDDPNAPEDNEK